MKTMEKVPWSELVKQGIFAALFIVLLIYTMNENKARELEYQRIIHEVNATNAKYADLIKIDLAEIKMILAGR